MDALAPETVAMIENWLGGRMQNGWTKGRTGWDVCDGGY